MAIIIIGGYMLKRVLSILLCLSFISLILPVNVVLSENNDVEQNILDFESAYNTNIENVEKSILPSGELKYTFVFKDGTNLCTIVENNVIRVYDEDGVLVTTSNYGIIGEGEEFVPSLDLLSNNLITRGASDYDVWRGWYDVSGIAFINIDIAEPTKGIIFSLIYSVLRGNNVNLLENVIESFVTYLMGAVAFPTIVYMKAQRNYNYYCSILVKERLEKTTSSGSVTYYGTPYAKWLSSPWSYGTCEYECRVLTEIY